MHERQQDARPGVLRGGQPGQHEDAGADDVADAEHDRGATGRARASGACAVRARGFGRQRLDRLGGRRATTARTWSHTLPPSAGARATDARRGRACWYAARRMTPASAPLDLAFVRAQFPALAGDWVFIDNAGGSQILGRVVDRIADYLLHHQRAARRQLRRFAGGRRPHAGGADAHGRVRQRRAGRKKS